jgi:molybdate transport system substrate-binding protein
VHNKLVVIIPKDNPGGLGRCQTWARSGVKVTLANSTVPVGKSAGVPDRGLSRSGVRLGLQRQRDGERGVERYQCKGGRLGRPAWRDGRRCRVQDECDAELAKDVTTIEIPDNVNQLATYPIAITMETGTKDVAHASIDFVLSSESQDILSSHRFIKAKS